MRTIRAFLGRSRARLIGFSLLEMLMVISIVVLLVGLSIPVVLQAREKMLRTQDLSNLRAVGVAILAYASENDQKLPGPTPVGQRPVYRGTDKSQNSPYLAYYLFPYLNGSAPDGASAEELVCEALLNRGLQTQKSGDTSKEINYVVNYGTENLPGDGEWWRRSLFGSNWYSPPIKPMNLLRLGQGDSAPLKDVWMICDVDQECTAPSIQASGWFSSLPEKPVHGKFRNFLFADGHVAAVSLDIQP